MYIYIYIYIYIVYFTFCCTYLKILLLTIHHNIQYDQPTILNYTLLLIAPYFTHCIYSIPEAVITAAPAPEDGCQHPKHVELSTEM